VVENPVDGIKKLTNGKKMGKISKLSRKHLFSRKI